MLRPLALLLSAAATLFAQTLPDWSGTWQGTLVNLPARAGANPVDVALEIGAFPAKDGACSAWRTTYKENGAVRQVKDYRLCRGAGAEDLYVDEGGLKLTARLLGEVLVSPSNMTTCCWSARPACAAIRWNRRSSPWTTGLP